MTEERPASLSTGEIDATVVVPTFNRGAILLRTLEGLRALEYPAGRFEIVLIDDGSTDGSADAAARWLEQHPLPARLARKANAGPAAARNHGARLARGRSLVFIDDDIGVAPDFLRRHLEALAANPGCWIMGRIVHPEELRRTPFGRYRDDLWELFHREQGGAGIVETTGMTAANLSLPRSDFERLGGFNEGFTIPSGEDWDLGRRARRAGLRVLYDPGIVVVHNDWAITLERFCERQRLYSVSDVLLWRKYGDESLRAALVRQAGPIAWDRDSPLLVAKKLTRGLLARKPVRRLAGAACGVLERVAPERACRWAYRAVVSLAIVEGVREGLRRYPEANPRGDSC